MHCAKVKGKLQEHNDDNVTHFMQSSCSLLSYLEELEHPLQQEILQHNPHSSSASSTCLHKAAR